MDSPAKDKNIHAKIKMALKRDNLIIQYHALIRMVERDITVKEIIYCLLNGQRDEKRDRYTNTKKVNAWSYSFEGYSNNDHKKTLRIGVGYNENNCIVVTAIDITKKKGIKK